MILLFNFWIKLSSVIGHCNHIDLFYEYLAHVHGKTGDMIEYIVDPNCCDVWLSRSGRKYPLFIFWINVHVVRLDVCFFYSFYARNGLVVLDSNRATTKRKVLIRGRRRTVRPKKRKIQSSQTRKMKRKTKMRRKKKTIRIWKKIKKLKWKTRKKARAVPLVNSCSQENQRVYPSMRVREFVSEVSHMNSPETLIFLCSLYAYWHDSSLYHDPWFILIIDDIYDSLWIWVFFQYGSNDFLRIWNLLVDTLNIGFLSFSKRVRNENLTPLTFYKRIWRFQYSNTCTNVFIF